MKKRVKNAGSYKRFYASGIPMYRERNDNFALEAGTMVNIIKVKTHSAICEAKCSKEQKAELGIDSLVLNIPLDAFAGDKINQPAKAEKPAKAVKSTRKAKVVAAETATTETATVENSTVVATETPVEVALEADPAVETPMAVEQLVETAV